MREKPVRSGVPAAGPEPLRRASPAHVAHLSAPGERPARVIAAGRIHHGPEGIRETALLFHFVAQIQEFFLQRAENVDHQPVGTHATWVSDIREKLRIHFLSTSRPSMWGRVGEGENQPTRRSLVSV